MKLRRTLRRLVRRLIPAGLRDRAKAIIGALGTVLEVVNATVPDYSDEAKLAVGTVIALATYLGIYDVPNVPAADAERGRGVPPPYQEP